MTKIFYCNKPLTTYHLVIYIPSAIKKGPEEVIEREVIEGEVIEGGSY